MNPLFAGYRFGSLALLCLVGCAGEGVPEWDGPTPSPNAGVEPSTDVAGAQPSDGGVAARPAAAADAGVDVHPTQLPEPATHCLVPSTPGTPYKTVLDVELGKILEKTDGLTPLNYSFQIYFPSGRAANAPFVFAAAPHYWIQADPQYGQIAADGSAALSLTQRGGLGAGFSGRMSPEGQITGIATYTNSPWSDSLMTLRYEAVLCRSDELLPAPWIEAPTGKIMPNRAFSFMSSAPVALSTLASLRVDGDVVVSAINGDALVVSRENKGWGPGAHALDVSGLRDALGGPLPAKPLAFEVYAPSAVVTDLSFAQALPAGSVEPPQEVPVLDGALRYTVSSGGPLLIALDGLHAGGLTFHHGVVREQSGTVYTRTTLVSADGELVEIPVGEGVAAQRIEARGMAPYYLLIELTPALFMPGFQPIPRQAEGYVLDGIEQ